VHVKTQKDRLQDFGHRKNQNQSLKRKTKDTLLDESKPGHPNLIFTATDADILLLRFPFFLLGDIIRVSCCFCL